MLAADGLRAVVIGLLALLSATGALTLWELARAVRGLRRRHGVLQPGVRRGGARHPPGRPARGRQLARPVRPAAGAAAGGPGGRRLADRVRSASAWRSRSTPSSFCVSAVALIAIGRTPRPPPGAKPVGRRRRPPGLRVHPPARVALGHAALGRRRLSGLPRARPRCCCPYMVKNVVHGSAESLGLVFAAGGLGAIGCALVMGQRGQPRRGVFSSTPPGRSRRSLSPGTASRRRRGS